MKVLSGLFYSDDHEWVKVEGNKAYIGITDFAAHQLGDIVYVELPELDAELSKGDSFGVIESVKAASDAYIPVSGKVIEINEALSDSPELINEDAYANWMIVVELENKSELDELMNATAYEEFISKEE
jgi:glycine cleavage system H protein